MTNVPLRHGWVPQPDGRGTYDIVWGCLLVLFVGVWTVLHLNVPARNESYWSVAYRKVRWALLAVCAPEMLTVFALMQWRAAKSSVEEMVGYGEWTIVHAFYANAGGFLLETPDCPAFPINATSIHYLCSNGWMKMPNSTREGIWDRSKADRFAKCVALIQAVWLLVQVIARGTQSLAITPLELFTVAFVVPTVATAFYWANKPQNVGQPTVIKIDSRIADILLTAGDAAREPYVDTPMDFIEKPAWNGWKRRPSLLHHGGLTQRPLERIPNDYSPPPTGKGAVFAGIISITHASIHLLGWSFPFPTDFEVMIWRASSLTLVFVQTLGGFVLVLTTQPWFDFDFTLLWVWVREARKRTWIRRWIFSIMAGLIVGIYIMARIFVILEIFLSLRALPADAYVGVNWSIFGPRQ